MSKSMLTLVNIMLLLSLIASTVSALENRANLEKGGAYMYKVNSERRALAGPMRFTGKIFGEAFLHASSGAEPVNKIYGALMASALLIGMILGVAGCQSHAPVGAPFSVQQGASVAYMYGLASDRKPGPSGIESPATAGLAVSNGTIVNSDKPESFD